MPLDMAMARRFFDEMDTDKSGTIRKCEVYIFLTKKQNKSKEEAIGVLGVSDNIKILWDHGRPVTPYGHGPITDY